MDLRSHILIQLATSERIVRDGDEVVPRFTIVTPEGPHIVVAQLPDGEKEHAEQLFVVRAFMIWKAASCFTFANKLIEPNAISVISVTRSGVSGTLSRIQKNPLKFSEPEWFGRENVSDEVINLLPPMTLTLSNEGIASLKLALNGGVPGITWYHADE